MTEASAGSAKQSIAAAAGFTDDWRGFLKVISLASGAPFMGSMLTIVLPILPNISKDISGGTDDPLLGRLVVAMPTMGIVLGGIIAGFLLTRFAARHVLLTAIVLFGIVGGAGIVLDGTALLASRFLIGSVGVCIAASSTTLIGDFIPADRRPRVLGLQTASGSLIGIIMMNLSGMLSDSFGWRASFMLFPAMAVVVILFGLALIPLRMPAAATASGSAGEKLSQWSLLKPLLPIYLLLMVLHIEAFTTNSQASFVLAADGVIDAAGRARMMSINQTMIVIAAISYPFTRALLGPRWIPALLFTCMTTGLLILGTQENLLIVGLGLAILGVSNGTLFPHQSTLILARAHPAVRGRAVGLLSSNQFFADSINPFILAPLIAAVGLKNAIATVGLMCGVGLLVALIYGVRTNNPPAPATAATGSGH